MEPNPVLPQEMLSASQVRRADGCWAGVARVSGMDCGACAIELEQAARRIQGLVEFTVNPASHLAHWVASSPQAIDFFVAKARMMGYALGLQNLDSAEVSATKNRNAARSRFLRFLVAALCMMQIMMYSTPEYIFSPEEIGHFEIRLLRWAQWVLALPLMLYCARPYFRRAWVATFQGRLVMDQPIVLGLLLAFVLGSLNLNNPAHHVWFDSIAMLLTLLLLVQMLVESQSARALNHLASLQPDLPVQVEVLEGAGWTPFSVVQLKEGQVYRLLEFQAVPVDSEVISQQSAVWVDEAMRTGELAPVLKGQGELVQAGSRILSAQVMLRTLPNAGGDSLLALGQLLLQALAAKPSHQDKVDQVLPWFVFTVLLCALGSALYWGVLKLQLDVAASAAVAVLIVTCPCALALALPLVRLFGIRRLAQTGVLVRNPQALDILAHLNVVAMDKTGTLTARESADVGQQSVSGFLEITNTQILNALYLLARRSVHPVSRAVATHLFPGLKANVQAMQWAHVHEEPGAGLTGVFQCNGESVELRLGSAAHCGLSPMPFVGSQAYARCTWSQQSAQGEALLFRVVLNRDEALPSQMQVLKSQGLSLAMLSGDQADVVQHWEPELRFDERLGELSPHNKITWIAQQQANKKCVAMLGDGLNDSGAFAQADVSFAAAGAATLSAGQADFLLLKPGLHGVLQALHIARLMDRVGRQNLFWALAYNCIAVPVAAMGLLSPWMASVGMGLSSLVVFVNALRVKQVGS